MLLFSMSIVAQENFKRNLILMGSRFDITVVASNEKEGNNFIDDAISEITRIENLISSWDPKSQTSLINNNAGIKPVKVSKELFNLIERSLLISKLTNGAFDISYASMDRIWKYDGSMQQMPSKEIITRSVNNVGYQNILLNVLKSVFFIQLFLES